MRLDFVHLNLLPCKIRQLCSKYQLLRLYFKELALLSDYLCRTLILFLM